MRVAIDKRHRDKRAAKSQELQENDFRRAGVAARKRAHSGEHDRVGEDEQRAATERAEDDGGGDADGRDEADGPGGVEGFPLARVAAPLRQGTALMPAPDRDAKHREDHEQDREAEEYGFPGHEPGGRRRQNAADQSDDEGAARIEERLDEIAVDLLGGGGLMRLVEIAVHRGLRAPAGAADEQARRAVAPLIQKPGTPCRESAP